jgi:HlyD family secretion protein
MPETIEIAEKILKDEYQNGTSKKVDNSKINQIRSEEVQEIISSVPNWMIRWGITLIFSLIIMLIALSWFVKYPDTIVGKATLTTVDPPVKLVVKSSGKLTKILMSNGSKVVKNQVIAEMENPVTQEGILFLKNYILQIRTFLTSNQGKLTIVNENHTLGIMQSTYNDLLKNLKDYQEISQNAFISQKINNLKRKIYQYKKLILISNKQLALLKQELENAEDKYHVDKKMYEKEYVAKFDFYKEETSFRQKQIDFESLKKTITEHKITLINLQQELDDIEYQYQENKRKLVNNIQSNLLELENGIENWQQNYSFVAPISGKLVWMEKLHPNQYVESGKTLFVITTDNEKIIVLATIPSTGFGKIKIGQKARIKLDNFPAYEFGYLDGKVTKMTEIPNENNYQVEIILNNGMISSYNKTLTFTPEMSGSVEIITEDLRIVQRVFNQFNKIFDKNSNSIFQENNTN